MKARWRLLLGAAVILIMGGMLAFEHAADARSMPMLKPVPNVARAEAVTPPAAQGVDKAGAVVDNAEAPRIVAEAATDLFATKSWYVPPPPPPPPKPVAPPFPYVFSGSQRDGDVVTALFVTLGERNFIVGKGDTLGGDYRLDDIVGDQAMFTYLPLQQQQVLQIGNAQ